jgi:hypothetical protein
VIASQDIRLKDEDLGRRTVKKVIREDHPKKPLMTATDGFTRWTQVPV